ncbi:MAG: OmpH family outer membrane protein [Pseudomonadota bacterium]|nr:OmpH family outer membrane protein [Pseudomonadota bacterium]
MLARLLSIFTLVFALSFAFAGSAFAQTKIATVDFQKALDNVSEGTAAKARLEGMFAEKKVALDKMRSQLEAQQKDLEKQSVILSDAAKKQKEEEFYQAQMQFQQAYQRSEGDMQQAYMGAMETLIEKMKKLSQTIATEKGFTIVIEVNEGGVIYASPTIDMTPELITRYNAANPAKAPSSTTPKK